jgi:hypothetical protein
VANIDATSPNSNAQAAVTTVDGFTRHTRAAHKIRVAISIFMDRGDDQSKIRTVDCFYAILSRQQ